MNEADIEVLRARAQLVDPCTLLYGVPTGAPALDDDGRGWSVSHWIHCARRAGHYATALDSTTGKGEPTWCGDIEIDALVYQVHRGLRKRILIETYFEDGTHDVGFGLKDSVWVQPVVSAQG